MTKKNYWVLREAIRRNDKEKNSPERRNPLLKRWLGLGFKSEYQSAVDEGLMVWSSTPYKKRCMGWLTLTEKGAAEIIDILSDMKNN